MMYMGIVAPPIEGKMNGNILLKRVSNKEVTKRRSVNQHMSTYFEINNRLKMGQWKTLFPIIGDISVSDFLSLIAKEYNIDEDVGKIFVFTYHTHTVTKKTKEIKKIQKTLMSEDKPLIGNRTLHDSIDGSLKERNLSLKDLNLRVQVGRHTEVEKDVSCDSVFMLNNMQLIGKSIRDAYSFLPKTTPVYLFMENAGGHGKTQLKKSTQKF